MWKAQPYWIKLWQPLSTSGYTLTCLISTVWYHVTPLRLNNQSCFTLNWNSVFWHALAWINNLLHNILVWTGGEIPADWNMWQGFDWVDPHFPFLLPLAQTPLYPFTPFREAVKQPVTSRLGWTRSFCGAQTCSQAEQKTHMGNSWWLSSSLQWDKWHKHPGLVMEIVWLCMVLQTHTVWWPVAFHRLLCSNLLSNDCNEII